MSLFLYLANKPPAIISSGGINDKLLHFLAYGLLSLLLYIPLKYNIRLKYHIVIFIISFIATISFGLIDEIHQSYIPIRTFDLKDLLADSIGAMTMLFVIKIFEILKRKIFIEKTQ
jgi:VanZ family protein